MKLLALLLLAACPTPDDTAEPSACFDEGGGFADHTEDDLAGLESECLADGGDDCSPGGFIEVDAAVCLATEAGLAAGIADLDAGLVYHHTHKTVTWNVSNLEHEETDGAGGSVIILSATTGEVLDELDWEAME